MSRSVKPVLVLLAVLALLGGSVALVVRTSRAAVSQLERKYREADLVVYYRVFPHRGPRFRLSGARVVRLLTHAVLPPHGAYDPLRTIDYGMRARVLADGHELWVRDIYVRSRQSKAWFEDGVWLHENAFTLARDAELSDDRSLELELPDGLPADALLELSLIDGAAPEALLRVYQSSSRGAVKRELALAAMSPTERSELVGGLSYTPWRQLRASEQLALVRTVWKRVPAHGAEGDDYETRKVFFSGFRVPMLAVAEESGFAIDRLHPAAIQVNGPGALTLEVGAAEAATLTITTLTRVGPVALGGPWRVGGDAAATRVTLQLAEGVQSIRLATNASVPVRVRASARAGAAFGDVQVRVADDGELIVPDLRRLPAFVAGPDGPAIWAAVDGPPDVMARVLRVEVRALGTPGTRTSSASGELTVAYEISDAAGRVLARQTVPIVATPALFERVVLASGELIDVAEPISFRLIVPRGARRVSLTSTAPTAVRLLTMLPGDEGERFAPPYAAEVGEANTWRYAPLEAQTWFAMRPENSDELAASGRGAVLLAQVRLQPVERSDPEEIGADGTMIALTPAGSAEQQPILEPLELARARAAAAEWAPGSYTPLSPGKPVRLDFGRNSAAPARVRYWVLGEPEASLGKSVTLRIDGAPAATLRLTTTRGAWRLPRVPAGVHTVEVDSGGAKVRLLVDQPPVVVGTVERLRTVYALDARPLRLRVTKRRGEALVVNMIVFAPGAAAAPSTTLEIVIDGGQPARLEGVPVERFTLARRVVLLPAATPGRERPILADYQSGSAGYARVVPIVLGADVAPGVHTIETRRRGPSAGKHWARFFMLGPRPRPEDRAEQFRYQEYEEGDE